MASTHQQAIDEIYNHFKGNNFKYDEEKHCKILIEVMMDKNKGTVGSFCIHPEVRIDERTFYKWVSAHEIFRSLYYFSKMLAKEQWEREGRELRDAEFPMGTINYAYDYWKMIGWARFGISKVSKVKIAIKQNATPQELYYQILNQATEGDFTAGEFKQLMEAVNVGLNVHQNSELQNQINELKSALNTMEQNSGVQNPFTDKGIAKTD